MTFARGLLKKNFQDEVGFVKCWIFKNRVTVLDFAINDNKIAFDFQVNGKKKDMKVWLLSRSKADSLNFLSESAIKIEGKKLLIFEGKMEEKNKMIDNIQIYLNKIASA